MSKSNNHHCMPEFLGKQKGESSPFFHIPSKNKLQEILLKESKEASFLAEEDLYLLHTFFHIEERERFLLKATESLQKRQTLAQEIQANTRKLSSKITELAELFTFSGQSGSTATKHCAQLAANVEKETANIRTNIIFHLADKTISAEDESIFLQIKKDALLLEIVYKILGEELEEWKQAKDILLAYPPSELISLTAKVLDLYQTLESFIAAQLLSAAKAAKTKNAEKYVNILYETSRHLFDVANILKSLAEA